MAAWLDVVRAIEDRNESFLQEKYDVLLGKLTSSSFLRQGELYGAVGSKITPLNLHFI